ncbi:MAG: dUTPase, partial [Pedosphaera sp.]|nr:dUTPase [Pedosphaera sp.]
LFRMQKSLNKRIGVHTDGMTDEQKTEWVLNYSRAMTQEIAELTDSVPWKLWAKYQKLDEQNARVEVVDLFHFLISLAQVLGMSADDVFEAYLKKNEVNFQRQDSGYTEKDQNDSKHIYPQCPPPRHRPSICARRCRTCSSERRKSLGVCVNWQRRLSAITPTKIC